MPRLSLLNESKIALIHWLYLVDVYQYTSIQNIIKKNCEWFKHNDNFHSFTFLPRLILCKSMTCCVERLHVHLIGMYTYATNYEFFEAVQE